MSTLYESPILLPAVLLAAGVVVFAVLNRRGRASAGIAALVAGVVLAVGAGVVARAVETPREAGIRLTHDLVRSGSGGDAARIRAVCSDRLAISSAGYVGGGRDTLVSAVERYHAEVTGARVVVNEAVTDNPTTARVLARVNLRLAGGQQVSTEWWFTWQREREGGFVLTSMEATRLWNQPADESVVRALTTGR